MGGQIGDKEKEDEVEKNPAKKKEEKVERKERKGEEYEDQGNEEEEEEEFGEEKVEEGTYLWCDSDPSRLPRDLHPSVS